MKNHTFLIDSSLTFKQTNDLMIIIVALANLHKNPSQFCQYSGITNEIAKVLIIIIAEGVKTFKRIFHDNFS